MRIVPWVLVLFCASAFYGGPVSSQPSTVSHTTTYRFRVDTTDTQIAQKTVAIMKARLKDADVDASVTLNANVVTVVGDANGLDIRTLLTERDAVLLKIVPNGPTYTGGGSRPFRFAFAREEPSNGPSVIFQMANPRAFQRFANRSVGRSIGVYVDGKLVQAFYLAGAFDPDGNGEITGHLSMKNVRIMAAQLGAGPLLVAVHAI